MTIYADPGPEQFRTEMGRAIFYSGSPGGMENRLRAAAAAERRGAQLIGDTEGGRSLGVAAGEYGFGDLYQYYKDRHYEELRAKYSAEGKPPMMACEHALMACVRRADAHWIRSSRHYAEQASGSVEAYVVGAIEKGTFRRVELPALLANEKVTDINGIPREDLAALSRTDAFERICEAELAREAELVRTLGECTQRTALTQDIEARREVLENWRLSGRESDRWQVLRRAELAQGERRAQRQSRSGEPEGEAPGISVRGCGDARDELRSREVSGRDGGRGGRRGRNREDQVHER